MYLPGHAGSDKNLTNTSGPSRHMADLGDFHIGVQRCTVVFPLAANVLST